MKADVVYKYIAIGFGYDYYNYVYNQLNTFDNTIFVNELKYNRILNRLSWMHFTYFSFFPFKAIWVYVYLYYLTKLVKQLTFDNTDKICFLLLAGSSNNLLLKYGLCKKIRKKFRNSKIVYFISDLVVKTNQPIELMKKDADLVISFDPFEAKKYGIHNHNVPYSELKFPKIEPAFDLLFLGRAKDRLEELLSIAEYLTSKGVLCKFYIVDVPEEKRKPIKGVIYSEKISYEENLKLTSQAACLLDIIQGNSSGNTLRVGEAVIMNRKLLTNNPNVPNNGIYNSKYMKIFKNMEDIDIGFLKSREDIFYDNRDDLYPINLLHYIENNL